MQPLEAQYSNFLFPLTPSASRSSTQTNYLESKMAAPPPGSGVQRASPVDADKLWRDRINQELQFQRAWVDEYGFMVDESKRETLRKGVSTKLGESALNESTGSKVSGTMTEGQKTLAELKSEMSYRGMQSVAHASYKVRPSPELYTSKEYNRRKFRNG
jgi:hypothetical protein